MEVLIRFYITLYIFHPWERNDQYMVECINWSEARRLAKILSAYEGAAASLSDSPGFKKEGEMISGTWKIDGDIKKESGNLKKIN